MGKGLPVFTVREINQNNKESAKNGATIEMISERDFQFKNERYLNVDTIQTMKAKDFFKFKRICHASMKNEKCFVLVSCCPQWFDW